MVKLIITNLYSSTFNIMCDCLAPTINTLDGKNLVFCDDKSSLMAERMLCDRFKGSINTQVYSFSNYLRVNKKPENLLTKEGCTMVVRKILSNASLTCFKAGKRDFASAVLELILQLKSANVKPSDLYNSLDGLNGILKNKLQDIYTVYSAYEDFLTTSGYNDQYASLAQLPDLIENSKEVEQADVYLVGFASLTSQAKDVVKKLIKKAKSVTAILVEGENRFAYVNQVSQAFLELCSSQGVQCQVQRVYGEQTKEGEFIANNIFNPLCKSKTNISDKIYTLTAPTISAEVERIAVAIKRSIIDCQKTQTPLRYKDITIAIPDVSAYKQEIAKQFKLLDIPYFLDERKKTDSHPLICLICAYIDIFRRGAGKKEILSFIKNPIWNKPKDFIDSLEKYIVKNNLHYSKFFQPFTFQTECDYSIEEFEEFRGQVCSVLQKFNVLEMLKTINAEQNLQIYTQVLADMGEQEEKAINEQIYTAVVNLLKEMDALLGDINLDYVEYKNVLLSGVMAMELSILPQHNDAVFIGDYRQIALGKTRYVFALGLTNQVPNIKPDVALLSDSDIDTLKNLKVSIEPKIKDINHRQKENIALALASFTEKLFLSYPLRDGGGQTFASEVFEFVKEFFTSKEFPEVDGYLTLEQGLNTFAKNCGKFVRELTDDLSLENAFYSVTNDQKAIRLAEKANQKQKIMLEKHQQLMLNKLTSPTAIESFYECPYKAFLHQALGLTQEDDGTVSGLSVGNVMHEIFAIYIKNTHKITDEASSKALFEQVKSQVLGREEYKRFLNEDAHKSTISRAMVECEKFCYKNYKWLQNSLFNVEATEVSFGKGGKYQSIDFLDGKVKLKGKIDRVDTFGDYCRIIDYKTGSIDSSEESLFAGVKLQLYLYANAINDKTLAGAYYMRISNKFISDDKEAEPILEGKTLNEQTVLQAQDKNLYADKKSEYLPVTIKDDNTLSGCISQESLQSYKKYALKLCQKAVKQMQDGLIVASPYAFDKEKTSCTHCAFKGICDNSEVKPRRTGLVKEEVIVQSVAGGSDE